jgi:hypothetical protein
LVVVDDLGPAAFDHEAGRDALGGEQVGRDLGGAGNSAEGGELAHLGPRDRYEVVETALVLGLHVVVALVVIHLRKRDELHRAHAGRV